MASLSPEKRLRIEAARLRACAVLAWVTLLVLLVLSAVADFAPVR